MQSSYSVSHQVNLQSSHTFAFPAMANTVVTAYSEEGLLEAISASAIDHSQPVLVLGGGSNVVFMSHYTGTIVQLQIKGQRCVAETAERLHLEVGAGEIWHDLVLSTVSAGWGGLENLALIPGTVGGAPIQNIGAYGVDFSDVFVSLRAIHLRTGECRQMDKEELQFAYRDSIFKHEYRDSWAITSVTLALTKRGEPDTSYRALTEYFRGQGVSSPTRQEVCHAVMAIRECKLPDPRHLSNAGSFFKNPILSRDLWEELCLSEPDIPAFFLSNESVKIPAAWLIEQCGWKGRRQGAVGVSDTQALVLVHFGGGSADELLSLVRGIQGTVEDRYQIRLEREVRLVPDE